MTRPPAHLRSRLEEVAARGCMSGLTSPTFRTGRTAEPTTGEARQMRRDDAVRHIECKDGFRMTVLAGMGAHSLPEVTSFTPARLAGIMGTAPRGAGEPTDWALEIFDTWVPSDYPGPYTHLEVGMRLPFRPPAEWDDDRANDDRALAVYDQVPVDMVRQLVAAHGGEVAYRARNARWRKEWTDWRRRHNRRKRKAKRT